MTKAIDRVILYADKSLIVLRKTSAAIHAEPFHPLHPASCDIPIDNYEGVNSLILQPFGEIK